MDPPTQKPKYPKEPVPPSLVQPVQPCSTPNKRSRGQKSRYYSRKNSSNSSNANKYHNHSNKSSHNRKGHSRPESSGRGKRGKLSENQLDDLFRNDWRVRAAVKSKLKKLTTIQNSETWQTYFKHLNFLPEKTKIDTRITKNPKLVEEWIAEHITAKNITTVGFDTEWDMVRFDELAYKAQCIDLVQICTLTHSLLWQCRSRIFPESLQAVLKSTSILKVGFGIDYDASLLKRHGYVSGKPNFFLDVFDSVKENGYSQFNSKHPNSPGQMCQIPWKTVVAYIFANSKYLPHPGHTTLSRWSRRILDPKQVQYAVYDVYLPLLIHNKLSSGDLPPIDDEIPAFDPNLLRKNKKKSKKNGAAMDTQPDEIVGNPEDGENFTVPPKPTQIVQIPNQSQISFQPGQLDQLNQSNNAFSSSSQSSLSTTTTTTTSTTLFSTQTTTTTTTTTSSMEGPSSSVCTNPNPLTFSFTSKSPSTMIQDVQQVQPVQKVTIDFDSSSDDNV